MTRALTTAAEAFEQTLEGLGLSGSEHELGDPSELGRRAAFLVVAGAVWRRHLGPMLDGKAVQQLLGVTTRQGVHDLVKRRRLLGVPGAHGQLEYPPFQFAPDGRPHAVMPRILAPLAEAGLDAHTTASWFATGQPRLDGHTPAAWLRAGGDVELVVEAARRAGARLGQ